MAKEVNTAALVSDGDGLYVELDGHRIAKRGHLGTPQAGQWVLEPGYVVTSNADMTEVSVEYHGQVVH